MIPYLHKSRPPLAPLTEAERALAAELRRDVEILASDIGPRGTFAPDRYALAERFLESSLVKAGYEVRRHSFEAYGAPPHSSEAHSVTCSNLEVAIPGTTHPDRIVIVGAHYDSVPGCPAANDNASGVAGVLAIARTLRPRSFRNTLRFVLFANEEPPHFNTNDMGSQHYALASRQAGEDIRGMICFETIGCYRHEPGSQQWPHPALNLVLPTVGDFVAFVGPTASKPFMKPAAEAFDRTQAFPLVAGAAPDAIEQVNWSDHRGFNEVGYPAFMVTDTAPLRYAHYHLSTDTPEKLDYNSMARVVRGLASMLTDLADAM